MIAVREFTSAAEMKAHAASLRAKFFKPQPVKPQNSLPAASNANTPKPLPKVIRFVEREPREWQTKPIDFNSHIIAYRLYMVRLEMEEDDKVWEMPNDKKSVSSIIDSAMKKFPAVTLPEIRGHSRNRTIVKARHFAMFEVWRQRPELSWPAIGRWFGDRHHTTIIHAVRKFCEENGVEMPSRNNRFGGNTLPFRT